jgi:hypothetical protein
MRPGPVALLALAALSAAPGSAIGKPALSASRDAAKAGQAVRLWGKAWAPRVEVRR